MILVTMNGNNTGYQEFWFEDETEPLLFEALSNLNYELDPNA